jgi:hypothetical protein
MGKVIRDRLQNRGVDKEESPQLEEDKNLDNIHEDPPDWSQGIGTQGSKDGDVQDGDHINPDRKQDLNTTHENLQLSQDGGSNKEKVAESKTGKAISDQGEVQVEEGVSLKEKEPEHFGSTHEQWPCLRCEQDNDDFTRNISEQQQGEIMACNHEEDSVMPNEWWHYFQYDDENEKFLPSGSELQHPPHAPEVARDEPALECGSSQEGTTSETNTTNMQKQLQDLEPDVEEPRWSLPTLTERVEILRVQFDAVLERNKHLEETLAALTKKENALEVILDRQTQQISSIDERQVEQERVLLAPMRSIYIRQFRDLVILNHSLLLLCDIFSTFPMHASCTCTQILMYMLMYADSREHIPEDVRHFHLFTPDVGSQATRQPARAWHQRVPCTCSTRRGPVAVHQGGSRCGAQVLLQRQSVEQVPGPDPGR